MLKLATALVATAALGSTSSHALRAPISTVGDSVALHFRYVGHVSPDGSALRLSATLNMSEPLLNHAAVSIREPDGKQSSLEAVVKSDGEIAPLLRPSDLLTLYNVIPLAVQSAPLHSGTNPATWAATVPVKISQTQWRDVPVRVALRERGDRADLDVSGTYANIVVAHGFTVGEDVKVRGFLKFRRGRFTQAHFDVHEIVHTYTDIPIAYEWTMFE